MLHGGSIHSASEPHAEALFLEDGVISWIGSLETAGRLSEDRHDHQDLAGALVTPAFVGRMDRHLQTLDAGELAAALDGVAARGWGGLRLVIHVPESSWTERLTQAGAVLVAALKTAYWHPLTVWPVVRFLGLGHRSDRALGAVDTATAQALELLKDLDDAAGASVSLEMDLSELADATVEETSERLASLSAPVAEAGRQLLLDVSTTPAEEATHVFAAARRLLTERSATPSPDRPTVLVDFDAANRQDWEALVGTGAHVLLRSPGRLGMALSVGVPTSTAPAEEENPWQRVCSHLHRSTDAVSVRAAFNAQARGAHRSLPPGSGAAEYGATGVGHDGSGGQLEPGAAATFAVWEVESLAVQAPDARTAAWSTDLRARTPLLPYIEADPRDRVLPRLRATVVGGVEVYGTVEVETSAPGDS